MQAVSRNGKIHARFGEFCAEMPWIGMHTDCYPQTKSKWFIKLSVIPWPVAQTPHVSLWIVSVSDMLTVAILLTEIQGFQFLLDRVSGTISQKNELFLTSRFFWFFEKFKLWAFLEFFCIRLIQNHIWFVCRHTADGFYESLIKSLLIITLSYLNNLLSL